MWTLRILFIATAFSCAVASADVTITVTTVADEDGVGSACSLREAIKAVNTHAPWGGCPAGSRNSDNTIKLSASTYVLASELVVTAPVTIEGVATERPDDINPYTGTVPNRVRPTTVIDADHNGRAINASGEILLKDLIIRNGLATENGGAIYTSANLTLDNVSISDSETGGDGGAVFLASKIDSTSAGLSMTDAMFLRNVAAGTGGAVSMTCDGALGAEAQHIVGVLRALFRENEANAGAGAFRICGNSAVTMDATTFDGNVSTSGKAAVTYESATAKGTISLSYLTAVRHDGFVLRIVGIDSALISNSFFAFNNAANCDAASAVTKTTAGDYNVLSDSSCSALMRPPGSNNVVNAALAPESQLGTQLTAFGNHGGLVDGYLPLRVPATVLIDKGQISTQCASLVDQRNLPRKSGSACDIGAFERLVPTANDDEAESTPKTNRLA
ncbi:MAG TPA: CSLREA domain-containing protein, partial [Moraxellaceae bacterium]